MSWESLVFRAYHWTPQALDSFPALEVFQHVIKIRQGHAEERQWLLNAGIIAHVKPEDQRKIFQDAVAPAQIGVRRLQALEVVTNREMRIRMIGSQLAKFGDEWARSHPEWMRWLAEQRVDRVEAQRMNAEWTRRQIESADWL